MDAVTQELWALMALANLSAPEGSTPRELLSELRRRLLFDQAQEDGFPPYFPSGRSVDLAPPPRLRTTEAIEEGPSDSAITTKRVLTAAAVGVATVAAVAATVAAVVYVANRDNAGEPSKSATEAQAPIAPVAVQLPSVSAPPAPQVVQVTRNLVNIQVQQFQVALPTRPVPPRRQAQRVHTLYEGSRPPTGVCFETRYPYGWYYKWTCCNSQARRHPEHCRH